MIRHFARFVILPIALFAVLLCAARAMGSAEDAPGLAAFQSLLRTAEGLPCAGPCLLGVQPGQTTMENAVAALRRHPYTAGYFQQGRTNFNGASGLVGLEFAGDGPIVYLVGNLGGGVASISLRYRTPGAPVVGAPLDLAVLLRTFGGPEQVVTETEGAAKVIYHNGRFYGQLAGARGVLEGGTVVTLVYLGRDADYVRYVADGRRAAWHGLGSLSAYQARGAPKQAW
jgi:hypothetical protein